MVPGLNESNLAVSGMVAYGVRRRLLSGDLLAFETG